MTRTIVFGLLGIALAVVVGVSVHLITRETISLPVARLEQAPALAPRAARERPTTATETETETTAPTTTTTGTTTGGDDHGGRNRGSGGGGNSGRGGGDDD